MIKYLMMIIIALALAGCKTDVVLSGNAGVDVDYSQAEVKMVNGILYIRTAQGEVTTDCIAIDPSALYADAWDTLVNQNVNRLTAYTAEEIDNCE